MKAIYTKIFDKYYKLNQSTRIPNELIKVEPGVNSSVTVDSGNKKVRQSIVINTLDMSIVKSNREEYKDMVKHLTDKKITDVISVPNAYKVYIDYSVFRGDKEISHDCVIRPVFDVDKIFPLGVSKANETVYKRVKELKETLDFKMRIPVPHGIKETASDEYRYKIKINNVVVYLDMFGNYESHESTYETPYGGNTSIVAGLLDTMVPIYSTDTEGYDFNPLVTHFMPRNIQISIQIIMSNLIVVYDDEEIEAIIKENIDAKCAEVEVPEADTGDGTDDPEVPDADTPGNDETVDEQAYEACIATDEGAVIIVADDTSDVDFNSAKMVKISDVLEDIPDAQIGQYVHLVNKTNDFV